eukprot:jgi/Bigna1/74685/fgenesh1_pg.30_\
MASPLLRVCVCVCVCVCVFVFMQKEAGAVADTQDRRQTFEAVSWYDCSQLRKINYQRRLAENDTAQLITRCCGKLAINKSTNLTEAPCLTIRKSIRDLKISSQRRHRYWACIYQYAARSHCSDSGLFRAYAGYVFRLTSHLRGHFCNITLCGLQMLSCWTAVFFLTRKEGPVILAMLCDQRLYMRHRQAIAMIYVLMAVYLSYTIALYYQIFQANFESSALHAHHYFNVTAEFLFNLTFAASVVVFSLVCLHVRDQVVDLTAMVRLWRVSHERHTIGQLSEHFDFVCEKLRVPQRFFGPFLHLTHICTIVRLGVILFWNFDEHRVMEGVWLQNVLLTVRVVAMCLLEDFIGSQVVTSTQKIQQLVPYKLFSRMCLMFTATIFVKVALI